MSIEQTIFKALPILISTLLFSLIVFVMVTYNPKRTIVRAYERINFQLKEKKNIFFNYEYMNAFLMANGGVYHYGKWVNPIRFWIVSLVLAVVVAIVVAPYHWLLAVISMLIGYKLPKWLLSYLNKADNDKMLLQLQTLYNALSLQVQAGVYVSDALTECHRRLPKGRLKDALITVSGELIVKKSFDTVIAGFNKKFNNRFIDSLCMILSQGQESGKAVEMLGNMSKQLTNMNVQLLKRKKASLDRTATICILGVVCVLVAVVAYALIGELFSMASYLD